MSGKKDKQVSPGSVLTDPSVAINTRILLELYFYAMARSVLPP